MRLKEVLHDYGEHLVYNPEDRNFEGAQKRINEMRQKIASASRFELYSLWNIPFTLGANLPDNTLYNIMRIATDITVYNVATPPLIHSTIFDALSLKNDTLLTTNIGALIETALKKIQDSPDPLHDLSHTLRVMQFKPHYPFLDWGTLATALAWHDIYRVDHVGFLYNNHHPKLPFQKKLRKITALQDFIIAWYHGRDSIMSSLMFLKESKNKLPKKLRHTVAIAMLGEHTLDIFEKRTFEGIGLYKNIVYWADNYDCISIARWETGFHNSLKKNKTDIHLMNRYIVLNMLFGIQDIRKKITDPLARAIFDIILCMTVDHGKQFYPTDARLALDHIAPLT